MLLSSLIPQNDLAELSKLPALLEHYRFHHSVAGGSMSLAAFLVEHYGAGTKHFSGCHLSSQHQQDHHNLPLRHHGNCPVVVFVLAGTCPALPLAGPTRSLGRRYRLPLATNCPDGPAAALLQPPRA